MDENEKKNSRIFYLTLAVVLTVVAVIVIAVTVAKRTTADIEGTDNSTDNTLDSTDKSAGIEDTDSLPEFILPLKECTLDVDFCDTVLVFSPTMKDYRTHEAVDLSAELGQEVMAVADGVVKSIWNDPFMGMCVSIEHNGNATSYYKNLDPVVKEGIEIGTAVKAGDVIGAVGETAMNEISQDPHLHFELKVDNKLVDPKTLVKLPTPELPSDDNKTEESKTEESK